MRHASSTVTTATAVVERAALLQRKISVVKVPYDHSIFTVAVGVSFDWQYVCF